MRKQWTTSRCKFCSWLISPCLVTRAQTGLKRVVADKDSAPWDVASQASRSQCFFLWIDPWEELCSIILAPSFCTVLDPGELATLPIEVIEASERNLESACCGPNHGGHHFDHPFLRILQKSAKICKTTSCCCGYSSRCGGRNTPTVVAWMPAKVLISRFHDQPA
jgi:hypothetical protein